MADPRHVLELPGKLETQLLAYRKLVWKIKLVEAVSMAVFGLFTAYLAVFFLDRFGETPAVIRGLILCAAAVIGD
ncbi:MAG: hypothetical protein U0903_05320 [Planctomycetales bacterium]